MTSSLVYKPGGRNLLAITLLLVLAAVPRLVLLERQGLWSDETFSLAIATGHSLEHPAAEARPELGDYVEPPGPAAAEAFVRYSRHDVPAASPSRVIRAVLLSDTSPPLYYLFLSFWTRLFGTGDAALRLFSVACSLACLPLVWSLARQTGGEEAAPAAALLFALAPMSLYYSTEGRMYSLVWLLACLLGWSSLALARRGARPGLILLWILTGVAGMLTHYFFFFVWCAAMVWLAWRPGALRRVPLALAVAATGLLVLPWILQVPASLSRWRVTAGWLDGLPLPRTMLLSPLKLFWSFFSARGHWGNPPWIAWPAIAVFLLLGVAVLVMLRRSRPDWQRLALPALWVLAACLGPLVFDLALGTHSLRISRYALAGLPAAMVLAGAALARLGPRPRAAFLGLILLAWSPGLWDIYKSYARQWLPTRLVARDLNAWVRPGDLVILYSIPSGILSVARYLRPETEIHSWVGPLGVRRVPEDLEALRADGRRVALVELHFMEEPRAEEDWLRQRASLVETRKRGSAKILFFEPKRPENPAGTPAPAPTSTRRPPPSPP